ncbi:MAG: ribosome recycling factor [Candidatus Liptonbacteria bacterium]|nr:ribosome recycling factor [Candidatus Liptonbacteria bacterium]
MDEQFKRLELDLEGAVGHFTQELQGVRSGRPSTKLLEHVKAEYAGQMLPIRELGSLTVKPPREIDIAVWDQSALQGIVKAIESANVGLSLSSEGNIIRALLPPLTEERRNELAKLVRKMAETVRINIRTHRDDAQKKLKASHERKEVSEDQLFKGKERLQKITDKANEEIDSLVERKLKELHE